MPLSTKWGAPEEHGSSFTYIYLYCVSFWLFHRAACNEFELFWKIKCPAYRFIVRADFQFRSKHGNVGVLCFGTKSLSGLNPWWAAQKNTKLFENRSSSCQLRLKKKVNVRPKSYCSVFVRKSLLCPLKGTLKYEEFSLSICNARKNNCINNLHSEMKAVGKLRISNCISESSCFACCGQWVFHQVWDYLLFLGCLGGRSSTFHYLYDTTDVRTGNSIFFSFFWQKSIVWVRYVYLNWSLAVSTKY